MKTIYVDNAATTPMSPQALRAMEDAMENCWGNASSIHTVGQQAAEALQKARESIASCIGANPKEIYFTSGGSESDNQALISAARLGEKAGKKHIISSAFEHHAILHTLDYLRTQGFEITLLPVHENGIIRPEEVEEAIREDTALVTIMYANNEIGTIQPIQKIGEICKSRNVLFHTDAVQAVGHLPVNVKADHIDMLSLSAHKFHGPKGIGVLFARKGIELTSLIRGGYQERGRRAGTENIPAIIGMAAALKEATEHMEENTAYVTELRNQLIEGLRQIPETMINGDLTHRLPGNVNVIFKGVEGESLLLLLDNKGIAASSGSACTSGSLEPSHVLLACGLPPDIAHGSLRLSLSEYNTEEDIEYILKVLPEIVSSLREMSPMWN